VQTIKEVPYVVNGDTITIEVPIDCPDQSVFTSENGKLKQTIKILNGRLSSILNIKPDTILIPVVETKIITKEIKVPQPVKFVPKFFKITAWFSLVVILLAGFYLYTKIK